MPKILVRFKYTLTSALLAVSGMFILIAPAAHAATKTWTGGGGAGDTNMNSATNWSGGAPVAGDDLVFPLPITNRNVVNNFPAATSFNSISFTGSSVSYTPYTISGSASLTIVGGIVNSSDNRATISTPLILNTDQTLNCAQGITLSGIISGSGNLIKTGTNSLSLRGNNTFSGSLTINVGSVYGNTTGALGQASGGTIVNNGGQLYINTSATSETLAEPITFNGESYNGSGILDFDRSSGESSFNEGALNLSGSITLGANAKFSSYMTNSVINITGPLSGAYSASVLLGKPLSLNNNSSSNTSNTPAGLQRAPVDVQTYSANSPSTYISVGYNQTAVVTGTYNGINVTYNGVLKGTGTVGNVNVSEGVLAPGLSPGVLNTGNIIFGSGTYQAEIGGTADGEYDQLNATGTVTLGAGVTVLDVSQYNDFVPTVGDTFTIINNDSTDAVSGTFIDLTEGATVTSSNGVEYSISYVGGDGNDVVLTAITVPDFATAPNTGMMIIKNNPIVSIIVTVISAAGIALIARKKYQKR